MRAQFLVQVTARTAEGHQGMAPPVGGREFRFASPLFACLEFELGGAWILIGVEFVSNFWLAHVCTHPHASTRLNRGAWREQK